MSGLTGTVLLTRLAVRRDRVVLPAWIMTLGLFVAATTAMFVHDFGQNQNIVSETEIVATNVGMRMIGLTSGATVGGYLLHREFVTLAALVALMSILAVVRHTRQNEELGRAEMLGATVVGRYAGLAAAVIVTVVANVVLAVVLGLAILVNDQSVAGSFLAGASVGGVGLVFTGVAAVTVQLASTTRGAIGMASAALGVSFLLSGVGNMTGSVAADGMRVESAWPVWLSPMGWGQQARPFDTAQWWVLGLSVALLVLLLAAAVALAGRRDVGRGMWPDRRGHAHAASALLSPVGLIWRLQRGAVIGWGVTMVCFGAIFGTLVEQIQDAGGATADYYVSMGGSGQIVDAYRTSMIQMAGMFVAFYVVQVLLRMRADEADGTWEPILATGVSRWRLMLGYLLNVAGGAALLVLVFALSMAITAGQVLGDTGDQLVELPVAALVQLPAILLLGAVVVLVVGVLPRWAAAVSWTLVVALFVIGPMFGPGLGLPRWVQDLSPFTHTPKVPALELSVAPLLVLSVVCLGIGVAGVLALRRRDTLLPA
jgi:ABC-2 type transport system permease protein